MAKQKKCGVRKKNAQTAKLEERWRAFAEAFLNIGKPTFQSVQASAIAAGYSESFARASSYKLLDYTGVRKWLDIIRKARAKKDVAPPEETLAYLTKVMRGQPTDLATEEGAMREVHELDPEVARSLVAGVKRKVRTIPGEEGDTVEVTLEYKLLDRLKATQMLAQYHGLLVDESRRPQLVKESKILVGYPVDPMPIAEWERQVRELMGYNQPVEIPGLPAPNGGV